jgi:excisionase family DNA binding protein
VTLSVVSGRGARDADGGNTRRPVSGIADASVCEDFSRLFVALGRSNALIRGMEGSRDDRLVEASVAEERSTLDEIAPGTRTSPKPDAGTGIARRLLSPEELASYLGVPRATVYRWRNRREGPCGIRVGRHVRYRLEEVERWLDEHQEHRS